MKDDRTQFEKDKEKRILRHKSNKIIRELADKFLAESMVSGYPYNWHWFGVPLIQYPEDAIMASEIVFKVKPRAIIETGTARGGSAIFYASLLKLLNGGRVISVDIDVRPHNRDTIEKHSLGSMVKLVEGSSSDKNTFMKVKKLIGNLKPVLVALDSSHAEDHVLKELNLYSKLVTKGSYIIVCDTFIKKLPRHAYPADRPWDSTHNPYTAIQKFLRKNKEFEIDKIYDAKATISGSPSGFLKKIR